MFLEAEKEERKTSDAFEVLKHIKNSTERLFFPLFPSL
jgi:hypothetical protein